MPKQPEVIMWTETALHRIETISTQCKVWTFSKLGNNGLNIGMTLERGVCTIVYTVYLFEKLINNTNLPGATQLHNKKKEKLNNNTLNEKFSLCQPQSA